MAPDRMQSSGLVGADALAVFRGLEVIIYLGDSWLISHHCSFLARYL